MPLPEREGAMPPARRRKEKGTGDGGKGGRRVEGPPDAPKAPQDPSLGWTAGPARARPLAPNAARRVGAGAGSGKGKGGGWIPAPNRQAKRQCVTGDPWSWAAA